MPYSLRDPYREAKSGSESLNAANDVSRPQDEDERHEVTEQDAHQEHVAELAPRRPNDGGVAVLEEYADDEEREEDAGGGERHRADAPTALRSKELLRDVHADGLGLVRCRALERKKNSGG